MSHVICHDSHRCHAAIISAATTTSEHRVNHWQSPACLKKSSTGNEAPNCNNPRTYISVLTASITCPTPRLTKLSFVLSVSPPHPPRRSPRYVQYSSHARAQKAAAQTAPLLSRCVPHPSSTQQD
jgi:hypothetical protein